MAHSTAAAAPVTAVNVSRRVGGDSGERGAATHGTDSGDRHSGEGERTTAAVSERSGDHETDRSGTRVSTAERSHGDEGSSSGGGGSGDGGSDGSDDGVPATPPAGSGNSGGSATDGGVAATTTNPVLTVAVPVTDTAAPAVEPVPTAAG
jgi:hypothetical protein